MKLLGGVLIPGIIKLSARDALMMWVGFVQSAERPYMQSECSSRKKKEKEKKVLPTQEIPPYPSTGLPCRFKTLQPP